MTISVIPTGTTEPGQDAFLAISGDTVVGGANIGAAIGAAFNALAAQGDVSAARVIIQKMNGDRFFGAEKLSRFRDLSDKQRALRERGEQLSAEDDAELEGLIDADLAASAERARAILGETVQGV